jgi:hypothetical protein
MTAKDAFSDAEEFGPPDEPRTDFGLAVGVDHYAGLPPLRGAVADAERFYAWMCDPAGGGVAEENARCVRSSEKPRRPVQDQVDDALVELLNRARECRDGVRRLYFHFSGHGAMSPKSSGADNALLLAAWSTINRGRALSSDRYRSELEGAGIFEEIAMFLDCCRGPVTGAVGYKPSFDASHFARGAKTKVFRAYATSAGTHAFEVPGCAGTQAFEESGACGWGGVFTNCLLSILRSAGSAVTAEALRRKLMAQLAVRGQQPHIENAFMPHSTFGAGGRTSRLEIRFLRAQGTVWLITDDRTVLEHDTATNPWRIPLPPGHYTLENGVAGEHGIDHRSDQVTHVEF